MLSRSYLYPLVFKSSFLLILAAVVTFVGCGPLNDQSTINAEKSFDLLIFQDQGGQVCVRDNASETWLRDRAIMAKDVAKIVHDPDIGFFELVGNSIPNGILGWLAVYIGTRKASFGSQEGFLKTNPLTKDLPFSLVGEKGMLGGVKEAVRDLDTLLNNQGTAVNTRQVRRSLEQLEDLDRVFTYSKLNELIRNQENFPRLLDVLRSDKESKKTYDLIMQRPILMEYLQFNYLVKNKILRYLGSEQVHDPFANSWKVEMPYFELARDQARLLQFELESLADVEQALRIAQVDPGAAKNYLDRSKAWSEAKRISRKLQRDPFAQKLFGENYTGAFMHRYSNLNLTLSKAIRNQGAINDLLLELGKIADNLDFRVSKYQGRASRVLTESLNSANSKLRNVRLSEMGPLADSLTCGRFKVMCLVGTVVVGSVGAILYQAEQWPDGFNKDLSQAYLDNLTPSSEDWVVRKIRHGSFQEGKSCNDFIKGPGVTKFLDAKETYTSRRNGDS